MASQLYRIQQGADGTPSGRELLDTLATLDNSFTTLARIFNAFTQQLDGNTGTSADYVTPANVYGFVDATGAVSSAVAQAAYAELNAGVNNCKAAIDQMTSRFRQ